MFVSLVAALAPLVTAQKQLVYTTFASSDGTCANQVSSASVDVDGSCAESIPGVAWYGAKTPPSGHPQAGAVEFFSCGSQTGKSDCDATLTDDQSVFCFPSGSVMNGDTVSCFTATFGGVAPDYDYTAVLTVPPSPPAEDDPCFPGSALVTTPDGRTVRLDKLKDDDEIMAVDSNGALRSDKVSMLVSVAQPEAQATFIAITTNGGGSLNLTAEHHVPVGAACCTNLKKAADIVVGDKVWVVHGTSVVSQDVEKLSKVVARGLHSPVLKHGSFPVVNGIVTSFDSISKVTLASYGLAPLLNACAATNTCGMLRYLMHGK
eukprot:CAMPEP_0174695868 /NCGR_PEP_ID=MMETSP1094-20130205/2160_1 /TAXON_ID=156173 /ORGANISM="Chrysochromulina brevifilum, Strain UTEX LB 985" /LENGTH=318 /DNA_ID=CAMNT_0015892487 /DNA_START=64 /DNA_END=1020 /DNA_ORIENTATION=-